MEEYSPAERHEMTLAMTLSKAMVISQLHIPAECVCTCKLRVAPLLIALTSLGQRSDSGEWKRMKRDC